MQHLNYNPEYRHALAHAGELKDFKFVYTINNIKIKSQIIDYVHVNLKIIMILIITLNITILWQCE